MTLEARTIPPTCTSPSTSTSVPFASSRQFPPLKRVCGSVTTRRPSATKLSTGQVPNRLPTVPVRLSEVPGGGLGLGVGVGAGLGGGEGTGLGAGLGAGTGAGLGLGAGAGTGAGLGAGDGLGLGTGLANAACWTLYARPAIVNEPLRAGPALASTKKSTRPLPVADPVVTRTHDTGLEATQAHPDRVDTETD